MVSDASVVSLVYLKFIIFLSRSLTTVTDHGLDQWFPLEVEGGFVNIQQFLVAAIGVG